MNIDDTDDNIMTQFPEIQAFENKKNSICKAKGGMIHSSLILATVQEKK